MNNTIPQIPIVPARANIPATEKNAPKKIQTVPERMKFSRGLRINSPPSMPVHWPMLQQLVVFVKEELHIGQCALPQ